MQNYEFMNLLTAHTVSKEIQIMNKFIAASVFAICATSANAVDITGAGSSFVYPVYSKWADSYKTATGKEVNYQSVGSGAGIKQIKSGTVDFGATDMPLKQEELAASRLIQFPTIIGGVVPVINLPEILPKQLKLTGEVLANIYLGKITKWNDTNIAVLNYGLKLPSSDITAIYRSDGSGTTYVFADYLSKVSSAFNDTVGAGTSVKWPVGDGSKGNEGVATSVRQIKGSIGYVEYAYAHKTNMQYVSLRNHDGVFVEPTAVTFKAAANNADWNHTPGLAVDFTDAAGKTSWPISSASFVLVRNGKLHDVSSFFSWAFSNGGSSAEVLDYVTLPDSVIGIVKKSWQQ